MRKRTLPIAVTAALLLVSSLAWAGVENQADNSPSEVAWTWFDQLYDVIKSEATPPPLASRIYGVSAVSLYEAVAPGTLHNRSLMGQVQDLASVPQPQKGLKYHWPAVANAALAGTIRGIFPSLKLENLAAIAALEQTFTAQFQAQANKPDYERSVALGQAVAEAILAWAGDDAYSSFHDCQYVPNPVDGAWEPTPPGFRANPLEPCWGKLRTMALDSGASCPLPGHPAFSILPGSEFHQAALDVYVTKLTLTNEQKTIADYWADNPGSTGTPAGHWIAIVGQIARSDGLPLAAAAEAFARVGIAVSDAFIGCWHGKYLYNLQRPVTYIRNNIDPTWLPYLATPPFPTYASGHSTQSGAAAVVLTDMFGIRPFTDTTHRDHNLSSQPPRSFTSFNHAAEEAAVSRLYAGIHYSFDNDDGLSSGRCIGQTMINRVTFLR